MGEQVETCERCQMKLPASWGTYHVGVRGGHAWRCVVCAPIAGKEAEREQIVKLRRAVSGLVDNNSVD